MQALGFLCSVILAAPLRAGGDEASPAALPPVLERAVERLRPQPSAEERARLARIFQGWDELLGLLPLRDLRRITSGDAWVELGFDFGRSGERTLEIPASTRTYWDAGRSRCIAKECPAERIRLRDRLRFLLDARGIRGIRTGDLCVRRYLKWWDVAASTRDERRIERDSCGRPRVCTDASGRALFSGGEPVLQECDRWLVLEALGRRVEVPLSVHAAEAVESAGGAR